ncbi:uncharacterized protein BO88DRAFT_486380 [Aspergillus vadensis CBS 113365]|uniref:Mid2 domain-containing protein n=1 Tax=Aspergillus vadensis (strain CBS 113365 / IMI 142717 / IBT 24658) TaxID=1448311 RepID=A0A319BEC1_ASPVC|nr:hypothetical protein BO88DRAFT_486380 [Aspergillus vadensis CBS 113365]PYH71007.1 hypothetical protein BO88DRAFT_486380 [Aspergillus vadensis CBS 113365]
MMVRLLIPEVPAAWQVLSWVMLLSLPGSLGQTTTALNTSIQDSPHFMGWYLGTTTQALTDAGTWSTSGQYAAGCTASVTCSWATACSGNILYYDVDNKTLDCGSESMSCQTMTIYQSEPYATPSAYNLFCADFWSAYTIYRELPATTTSTTSATSDSTASATTAPITSMATQTSSATQTSTASPSSTHTSSSGKSQAWIAGPVIGAVVGVGAIAAAVIFFLRRRITRGPQAMEYQSVSPGARTVSELPTESLTGMVHEMPSTSTSRVGPYELS